MLYKYVDSELQSLPFYDYMEFSGKEKDLENLLATHLGELYVEDGQLMPISQERQGQEEPDICALDAEGNLVIFELKRGTVPGDTTLQAMRYAQSYAFLGYSELNLIFPKYVHEEVSLAQRHAEAFQLKDALQPERFNQRQKLVLVGSSTDVSLINAVNYWQKQGIDIDFLPYRFYKIGGEIYFEFFAKPYDFHVNPRDKKGIMIDTNLSYDKNAIWDMLSNSKISAYGGAARYMNSFAKGDYALFYHVGYGVIAAGTIKTGIPQNNGKTGDEEERYQTVEFLTPVPASEAEIRSITASELKQLLGKNFYYRSTMKTPFLSAEEAERVIAALNAKYSVAQ